MYRYMRRGLRGLALVALATACIMSCGASNHQRRVRHKAVRQASVGQSEAHGEVKPAEPTDFQELVAGVIRHGEKLLGRRYRTRGVAPWPLDCSGYVSYIYSLVGVSIPRSSAALSTFTQRIKDPQPGDLVFFRGRNARSRRVGHVALVVDNQNGDLTIMHSTNSRGIIKHRLSSNAYFRSRYLFAGRIPSLTALSGGAIPASARPTPLLPEKDTPSLSSLELPPAPIDLRPSPLMRTLD